jgi:hypothetical protein
VEEVSDIRKNLFENLAGAEGFEPPTIGFGDRCSTNWNYAPATNAVHYTRLYPKVKKKHLTLVM